MSIEIYPVVHINDTNQALSQAEVAFKAGSDGVFLIDHHFRNPRQSLEIFDAVLSEFENKYVGLNLLFLGSSFNAYRYLHMMHRENLLTRYPNGLWVDDAVYDHEKTANLRENNPELNEIQLLGGVAFKYTSDFTEDPTKASNLASAMLPYIDVITTSGAGTGIPPTVEKIAAMKAAIGDNPLAVGSGIDESIIGQYAGILDKILVASSIETSPYSGIFDPRKLASLVAAAHNI